MRKIKVILKFSFVFLIAACSSSSKVNRKNSIEDSGSAGSSTPKNLASSPSGQMTLNAELVGAIKKGHDEEISRVAYRVLSADVRNIYGLNALAMVHYQKGEFAAAQLLLERAMKENQKNSDLHNNIALVKLALKDHRQALRSFRTALSLNPNDKNAAANVGALYLQSKDYQKALIALEMVAGTTNDKRILLNYAVALVANRKNYEKAEGIYKSLMKSSPADKNIMFNYSILLIDHLGKNREGLDLISKIKFLGPSSEIENKINTLENKAKTGLTGTK